MLRDMRRDTFQCTHLHMLITRPSYTAMHACTYTHRRSYVAYPACIPEVAVDRHTPQGLVGGDIFFLSQSFSSSSLSVDVHMCLSEISIPNFICATSNIITGAQ